MLVLMLSIFIVTLILGIPIAICLGVAGLIPLISQGFPLAVLVQKIFLGQHSFLLLAVPLFILAGDLMVPAGILEALLRLINLMVGRFKGGLGHVIVLGSMVFSGTSGSAMADASAIGATLIPIATREYKDSGFAASITAAASTIGPIIPPSIPMIFYSLVGEVSVIGLFLAGVIPGLIMGIGLMIFGYFLSVRRKLPVTHIQITFRELSWLIFKSLPILIMPVIIIGGILCGVFTPTEAAVVAVFYVLLIGLLFTKKLKLHHIRSAFINAATIMAIVFFILSTSTVVAFELTIMNVPEIVAEWFISMTSSQWVFLLLVDILCLVIGMILEPFPAMLILVPIFEPVALTYGVHPIHFGFIVVLALIIGLLTPPVGPTLYICGSIAKLSIEQMSRNILPWLACLIFTLLLVTFVSPLVLWLPKKLGYG
jgi:tripartite ATP-independent transporter DctM subunit